MSRLHPDKRTPRKVGRDGQIDKLRRELAGERDSEPFRRERRQRNAQAKARRPDIWPIGTAPPKRPARVRRELTPEELAKVADLHRAGLVHRLPKEPPTGLPCACSDTGQCLAHAKARPEGARPRAVAWLPVR